MNFLFEYDSTFPGFLCACAELFNTKDIKTNAVVSCKFPKALFEERISVQTDEARATNLWHRISRKFSPLYMEKILGAFLSDTENADKVLANYIFKVYKNLLPEKDVSDNDSMIFETASRRALGEAHLHKGIIRFSQLNDGSFYAQIKPECNILPLIGNHFSARFNNMNFVIHDVKRSTAIFYEINKPWQILQNFSLDQNLEDIISTEEKQIRVLWKLYHETVAIKERTNPGLQMNFMPKHYWEYITEMKNKL